MIYKILYGYREYQSFVSSEAIWQWFSQVGKRIVMSPQFTLWHQANARYWCCDIIFNNCSYIPNLAQMWSSLVNISFRPCGINGLACKKWYCIKYCSNTEQRSHLELTKIYRTLLSRVTNSLWVFGRKFITLFPEPHNSIIWCYFPYRVPYC